MNEEEIRNDMLAEARFIIDVIQDYAECREIVNPTDLIKVFDTFVEQFQSLY